MKTARSADYKMYRIKILADSRGRGLADLLNGRDTRLSFTVESYPGASILSLKDKLSRVDKSMNDLIIIFGVICSVTKITYMPYRAAVMRHTTIERDLQLFKEECNILLTEAVAHLPTPVLLSPFVGVDLVKYAGHYDKLLFEMQELVDASIPQINTYVKKVNDDRGLTSLNISSCIHRCPGKGKGYHTHYLKLVDGCHPSDEVKLVCSMLLYFCVSISNIYMYMVWKLWLQWAKLNNVWPGLLFCVFLLSVNSLGTGIMY